MSTGATSNPEPEAAALGGLAVPQAGARCGR
jgi:hypothetical protein